MVTAWLEPLWLDVRLAFKQLRRAPAFTAAAVLTLALGIGANTGIFSLINGFLRPLPVPAADRIVILAADLPGDETGARYRFSFPALADYRAQADVFSDVFGYDTRIGGMAVGGKATQFLSHYVTGNFFSGLGLTPALGRLFRPGEGEQLGSEPVVVLGYAYWMKRFGGSPDVLDALVRIDGEPARVIGVAPEGFRGLFDGIVMDGYVSLGNLRLLRGTDRLFSDRSYPYLTMAGRLKPGVSLRAAQAAVDTVAARLASEHPATERGVGVRVVPEPYARPMPLRFFATIVPVVRWLLLVLAALVLLIACLNVTNLLFVRATVRQRELAVRSALGAGRGSLIRLLLVESFVLALFGAVAGMLLGQWAGELVIRSIRVGVDLPITFEDVHFDWTVFGYGLTTAMLTSVAVGILPAIRASGSNAGAILHDDARSGSAGPGRQRLRSALVVAQIAGSLVLLVVAGLFVRNLQRAEQLDLGFDPSRVLTLRVDTRQAGYDLQRTTNFYDELERRVRAMPDVEHAALSAIVPMTYAFDSCPIEAEDAPVVEDKARPAVGYNLVGTDYFATLGLPIERGRAFTADDTPLSPRVVVVNETLARRMWPGRDPIGKRLTLLCTEAGPPWQVVGVARNSKYVAVFESPLPYVYLPAAQVQPFARVLQVRSASAPGDLSARVQAEIERLEPQMSASDVRTMHEAIGGGLGWILFRFGATQATAMGFLGLLLAVVGVYGVVSYGASQRVREIGIRIALGADASAIRSLILRQGASLVIVGIGVGLVVSVATTMLLTRFLVLITATDPIAFVGVTAGLVAVALAACYLPARRAMKVDAMIALRHE